MSCHFPMQGFRSKIKTSKGKRKLVFNRANAYYPELLHNQAVVGCGQCLGCRLERSRQWAIRCVHESSLFDKNCFITLTYSSKFLPPNGSLVLEDFQKFMKRLRKRYGPGIRYYHCGEYGTKFGRPHYHAILFNIDFPDQILWKSERDVDLFRSESLEEVWPFGYSSVGTCTFESAAYVARYILKKVTGDRSFEHYACIDHDTGELLSVRKPEYTTMSRRPGIGKNWFEKYYSDVYPNDYVVFRNKQMRPPKFYDSLYEVLNPDDFERLKKKRKYSAIKNKSDNTPERLNVKHQIKLSQVARLPRSFG